MNRLILPEQLEGNWIWHNQANDDVCEYVMFRREFVLDESPSQAEIWIAANTIAHVQINGRHIGRADCQSSHLKAVVDLFDCAFALQVGRNVITITVLNLKVSQIGQHSRPGKLWSQLNLEQTPQLVTDASWSATILDAYISNQPRVSIHDGFVETVDLNDLPLGASTLDFVEDETWTPVKSMELIDESRITLIPTTDLTRVNDLYNQFTFLGRGVGSPNMVVSYVAYVGAVETPGVFAAETYLHSMVDADEVLLCVSTDDPYYLYLNHELIHKPDFGDDPNWMNPEFIIPQKYAQDGQIRFDVHEVSLKRGPNKITILQNPGINSAGVTLRFPQAEHGAFKITRGKEAISMPGWEVNGPLKVAFNKITDPIHLSKSLNEPFYGNEPLDTASYLQSVKFSFEEDENEGLPFANHQLKQGEYILLELDEYTHGCLNIAFDGYSGDILDVMYGDRLIEGVVEPIDNGVRKVYTVALAEGTNSWQAVTPHGMKFVMIYCRNCDSKVAVANVSIRRQGFNMPDTSTFSCSDELFNRIWDASVRTLNATYHNGFMNYSGHSSCQFLPDAMIQGISSLVIHGSSILSKRELLRFATNQYETGEIPSIVPSDIDVRLVDSMLLWCVWLQKHILYSGDLEFLKKMMPQLKRLLVFVENLAGDESVLLGFEDGEDALPCLLDDDQKMDRLGVSTALNCLYCYALLKCEWMFQLLEEDSYVDYCHGLANEIAKTLRRICWDDKKNLFVDTFYQGERSEHCSMQTNILAMLSGVASEKMSNRIQGQMFLDYAPYLKMEYDFENESAYFKYFILETIYNIGDSSWATDYIRYYWGKMIEYNADTWWEKFSPSLHDGVEYTDPPSSACNGYGVSANYFIMSEIVGIRPVAENFKQIYLSPQIVDLEWCSASLPTPHGVIKVEWNFRESGELVFSIDANYELEVVPQFDASLVATDTIMKIGDSVNILQ